MISELDQSIEQVMNDSTGRVVILRSAVEKCFSSGADLKERALMSAEEVAEFVTKLRDTFSKLEFIPVPTIAAIDGFALGGGLELALCCDLRYINSEAKLGLPETKLAILPAAGGSQRLSRLIGVSKAKELIFTGSLLDSEKAFHYGLVNGISVTSAFPKAMEIASKISENG